jgi:ribulose-phosphate 3-epimerase
MCADYLHLEDSIKELEKAGVEYLHFDIMDGRFVPNFTFGPDFLNAVRGITDIPFDIHLMVERPELHLISFDIRPNDIVSVHQESTAHLLRVLQMIAERGAKPGVALNPATQAHNIEDALEDMEVLLLMTVNPGFAGQKLIPSMLGKIRRTKQYLMKKGFQNIEVEVDGNVSFENARIMKSEGADIFVAGSSSVFIKGRRIEDTVAELRRVVT